MANILELLRNGRSEAVGAVIVARGRVSYRGLRPWSMLLKLFYCSSWRIDVLQHMIHTIVRHSWMRKRLLQHLVTLDRLLRHSLLCEVMLMRHRLIC